MKAQKDRPDIQPDGLDFMYLHEFVKLNYD